MRGCKLQGSAGQWLQLLLRPPDEIYIRPVTEAEVKRSRARRLRDGLPACKAMLGTGCSCSLYIPPVTGAEVKPKPRKVAAR